MIIRLYWSYNDVTGTFGIKNLRPYFQVCQHKCSISTLELIEKFIKDIWEKGEIKHNNVPLLNFKFSVALNKTTDVYSYVISDIDVLYYIILPIYSNLKFKSRKETDFKLWTIVLLLFKKGYYYSPLGKNLIMKIINNINKKRYTTSKNSLIESDFTDLTLLGIFKISPIIKENPYKFKSHTELVREYVKNTKKKVYVYENGIEVPNSPFNSYNEAQNYLEIKSKNIITRYIDTNKVYNNKYTFYSECKKD